MKIEHIVICYKCKEPLNVAVEVNAENNKVRVKCWCSYENLIEYYESPPPK